jgi:hypothetical protein
LPTGQIRSIISARHSTAKKNCPPTITILLGLAFQISPRGIAMLRQLNPIHWPCICQPGALLLALVCAVALSGSLASAQEPPVLEINKPIEQSLAGGASHSYRVRAAAG